MDINILGKIGIFIIVLDFLWILIYYYYGAAKVYNLTEKRKYQYMGCFWIRRKKGEYCLKIPQAVIADSMTTQYKIVLENMFAKDKKEMPIRICFGEHYDAFTEISTVITVKNHVATSNQL